MTNNKLNNLLIRRSSNFKSHPADNLIKIRLGRVKNNMAGV
jgi:hypothetical protein